MFAGILLLPFFLRAQIWDYSYTHYGKADGLPSNTIYAVTTDQQGVLWIGSDAGVTRFDGAHMRHFTTDDGLPSNDVFRLFCDAQDRIWVFGLSSQAAYIQHDIVHNRSNDSLLSKIKLMTTHNNIFEFSNGAIWITSTPKLIYEIKGNQLTKFELPGTIIDNLLIGIQRNDSMYCLGPKFFFRADIKGRKEAFPIQHSIPLLGIASANQKLYGLKEEDNKVCKIKLDEFLAGKYFTVRSTWKFISNSTGHLFHIQNKGILEYSSDDVSKSIAQYLPSSNVATLYEDKNKNLWLPTLGHGLFLVNYSHAHIYQNEINETANKFLSLYITRDYYFLGNDNNELSVVDRKTKKLVFRQNILKNASFSNRVMRIIPFGNNQIFCSTDLGVHRYHFQHKKIIPTKSGGSSKNINMEGDTLVVQNSAGIIYYKPDRDDTTILLLGKRTYSYIRYNGEQVVGAEDGLYQLQKNIYKEYELGREFKYRVMDMINIDSMLVLATINNGVVFIKNHQIVRIINKSNGLSHSNCFRMVKYHHQLFVATSHGISIIDLNTFETKKIFEFDGLASNTVNDIQIDSDTLYAATDAGLSVIPIQNISSNINFKFFLQPIIVGQDTLWKDTSSLSLRTNQLLNVTCNSLSYSSKGDIIYFYRIRELDSAYAGTRDQNVSIEFKEPGDYTLDFFGKDANGNLSNQVTLQVHVIPFVYQTTWFKFLIGLLCIGVFFLSYKWFLHRIRKREQQKSELAQKIRGLELIAWKSTINPHFLFNSLNTMQSFFSGNDFVKANRFLSQFSTILRKTIDQSSKLMIQIDQEISYLQNYLELEKIKRYDDFSFQITLRDEEIKSYFIPTLVLQPILENSLKHGIRDNENGKIDIEFDKSEQRIVCTICDNGRGLPQSAVDIASSSKGIKLVKDKIAIIENMIQQKIPMTMSNRVDATGEILGCQTVFSFPIITFDLDDKNSTHR